MSDITKLRRLETFDPFEYKIEKVDVPAVIKEVDGREVVTAPADKKIFMKGILQKADTLNQNGRIYPLAVLEREVRNYQKFIIENRATGELDHPDCVSSGYHWLSSSGWKPVEEIAEGMKAATLDADGNIVYQSIQHAIHRPYKGDMIRIWNSKGTIEQLLTPNHRMLLWDRTNKPYYVTALEFHNGVINKDSKISHSSMRRAGTWTGEDPEMLEIAGKQVESRLWAAFLGIYLAEGHARGILSGTELTRPSNRAICVTQIKPDTRKLVGELMALLPWEMQEIPQGFKITDSNLYSHLFALGSSHNKHVPAYTKNWSPRLLQIMLDWMLMGDGRNRYGYKKECTISEYCTTSPQLADDVSEIMIKLGYGATIHKYQPTDRPAPDFATTGRMILEENSQPMHIVYQHSSKSISTDVRFVKTEIVNYDGDVHCMTVPNSNWLARSPTGQVFWTGNCSVVNLKNVSHIVREAYMENGVVIGTIEVLHKTQSGAILAGLVESGVKIGISSRGVGSTRKQGDYYVVQDDFQLICWDMVSEPSTPGAFMIPEGRIIEAAELKQVFNRTDRINRVLNELLSCQEK